MKSSVKSNVQKKVVISRDPVESQVHDLNISSALYAAMQVRRNFIDIAEIDRENSIQYSNELFVRDPHEKITSLLRTEAKKRNIKYIAVDIRGDQVQRSLISRLWLGEDIVPYVHRNQLGDLPDITQTARDTAANFNEDNIAYVPIGPDNEVLVSELVSLNDYRSSCSPYDFTLLQHLTNRLKGKKLVFINATPQGGGVALMRHALIRLYKLLGVDAKWYVMIPNKQAFNVTKTKFHNVLQGVAPQGVELTEEDKNVYNEWIKENAEKFAQVSKTADVVIIDDPQPCGMIPHIKRINPKVKIIYRSHIQIVGKLASTEGTPQRKTWSFLWNNIKHADLFVSHPIREFIPDDVPKEKIVYMPATTDPLDGLNKPLKDKQLDYYMRLFNKLLLVQEGQTPLDSHRPYIVQIARFDPSKGIPDVVESYRLLRQRLQKEGRVIPQLVIAGNASIDDPDGVPIYTATMELLKSAEYRHLAHDVKVARLPHVDQLLNALLRKSRVVLQLSHKEGFEVKVTEALMKGKPVIAYRAGGIPLQIEEAINGYLVETGHTHEVAERMYDLFTNEDLYNRMSIAAEEFANKDYLTVTNAVCWLFLARQLIKGRSIYGHHTWVKDLARVYFSGRHVRNAFSLPLFSLALANIIKIFK